MKEKKSKVIEEHKFVMPGKGDVVGVVTKSLGATNFLVLCSDDKERKCTIPGKLKRSFWIKEGDIVLVKPWVVQSDERGDIIWRYSLGDKEKLLENGYKVPE
ncbi:MAG: translation initiation factor eIF-1A [Candidatus Micrarchaeaceae archaeon]